MSEPTDTSFPGDFAQSLDAARHGSDEALGRLLQMCRAYLLTVAHGVLGDDLNGKVGSSDLVQDTFLQAQQHFARFQGNSEAELLAWLRAILLNGAATFARMYRGAAKRQLSREVPLDLAAGPLDVAGTDPSPSAGLAAEERDETLRQALAQLPDDYRQVIAWRNYEGLEFEEIGKRLNRSAEAARKLWGRGLVQLRRLLEPEP